MEKPRKFGRFEVRRILGRGAMGIVYLADDTFLGRKVAIKTTKAHPDLEGDELDELRERFVAEARSASALSHPNLVTVYDVGQEGDDFYIAMEYVRGEGLDKVLRSDRVFSFKEVSDLAVQVASALDYAHANHIVHRDIKPANIMVARDGRPKIADFGVARRATSTLTRTGTLIGTPAYMSPEQITGHPVSGASDQFSFAVVLFRMLTGEQPFEGENPTTVMYKIVHEEPRLPRTFNEQLPEAIDRALVRGLAKDPAERYPSCVALAEAVREALGAARPRAVELLGTIEHSAIVSPAHDAEVHPRDAEELPVPEMETSSPDAETLAPHHETAAPVPHAGAGAKIDPRPPAEADTPDRTSAPPSGADRSPAAFESHAAGAGGLGAMLRSPAALGAAGAAAVLVVAFLGWILLGGSAGTDNAGTTPPEPGQTEAGGAEAPPTVPQQPAGAGGAEVASGGRGAAPAEDTTAVAPEAAGAGSATAVGATPGALEITLRTSDDPARVRLNGEDLVDGTPLPLRIEPGTPYSVVVEKDGYQPVSWSFSLDALSPEQVNTQELYFPLRPAVPEGGEPAAVAEPRPVSELPLGDVDPIRLPSDGERPVAIEQVDPELPDWAAQQGLPSYVVVELVIDAQGRVREAEVLGDGIHPELDKLALDAVRQWLFEPARVDGEAVAVHHNLAVVFRRDR